MRALLAETNEQTYLNTTGLFPSQLNLAELALSDGVAQDIFAKLGLLLPF